MKKKELNAHQVIERLAIKYSSPQYGFITQVRNGTGYSATRTADAMAMSLWPSRGLYLLGFEVKVSRADWLKELKTPEKAEEIAAYCHYWYVVVGNKDIVKEGELPQKWGLIVPSGKGLKILKEAPFDKKVMDVDLLMLAGIFRNIAEQCVPKEVIQRKLDERFESGKDWAKSGVKTLEENVAEFSKAIDDFEKASGVKIEKWGNNKDIGLAVKHVLSGRDKEAKKRLLKLGERAKNIVKFIEGENIAQYDC